MVASAPDSHRITRLGDYAIVRVIGEGGMGIVYEAVERLSQRRVALKVMHSNVARQPGARERFFNEMRISAALDHPNIVRGLACTEIDGRLVIVLEYLEGHTLRDELARGPLPPDRAIRIAMGVAAALAFAHERPEPIVHRDLKPENLMLLPTGTVKVMDFGVAKVMTREGRSTTTEAIGTVAYMSPEQAEGRTITPSTDIYALGVVLYEMLVGAPPFDGPSLMVTLRMQCEAPPPPFPEALRRTLPGELESLVMWTLQKAPARRAPSARAVLERLGQISTPRAASMHGAAPGAASPSRAFTPAPQRLTPSVVVPNQGPHRPLDTFQLLGKGAAPRRWPWIAAAAALALGVSALATWFLLFQVLASAPKPKRKVASTAAATAPVADEAAPPPLPKIPEPPRCSSDLCAALNPPNLASVEFETVVAQATQLAQTVDPASKLSSVSFLLTHVVNGRLDMTARNGGFYLMFTKGVDRVEVTSTQLELSKNKEDFSTRDPMPAISCTMERAWNAAIAKGFQVGTHGTVELISKRWEFGDRALQSSARVDLRTCDVTDVEPPRKHPD